MMTPKQAYRTRDCTALFGVFLLDHAPANQDPQPVVGPLFLLDEMKEWVRCNDVAHAEQLNQQLQDDGFFVYKDPEWYGIVADQHGNVCYRGMRNKLSRVKYIGHFEGKELATGPLNVRDLPDVPMVPTV